MVQRLTVSELVTAILLVMALASAGVRLAPIAIERWF